MGRGVFFLLWLTLYGTFVAAINDDDVVFHLPFELSADHIVWDGARDDFSMVSPSVNVSQVEDGKYGNALRVGLGGSLCIATNNLIKSMGKFAATPLAISFWVRGHVPAADPGPLITNDNNYPPGGGKGWSVSLGQAPGSLGLHYDGTKETATLDGVVNLNTAVWENIMYSVDPGPNATQGYVLYRNGVLVSSSGSRPGAVDSNNGICIGNTAGSDAPANRRHAFDIDEVVGWNAFPDAAHAAAVFADRYAYQATFAEFRALQTTNVAGAANTLTFVLTPGTFALQSGAALWITNLTAGSGTPSTASLPVDEAGSNFGPHAVWNQTFGTLRLELTSQVNSGAQVSFSVTLANPTAASLGSYPVVYAPSHTLTTVSDGPVLVVDVGLPQPIVFTLHPAPMTLLAVGGNLNLTSATSGPEPATSYQWFRNGISIPGATLPYHVISSAVAPGDAGNYTVTHTGPGVGNNATSNVAVVIVYGPPVITMHPSPANVSVAEGLSFAVSITATSPAPMTYQWRRDGVPLAGQTGSSLSIPSVARPGDAGVYDVVVDNGSPPATISNTVTLDVTSAGADSLSSITVGTVPVPGFTALTTVYNVAVAPMGLSATTVLISASATAGLPVSANISGQGVAGGVGTGVESLPTGVAFTSGPVSVPVGASTVSIHVWPGSDPAGPVARSYTLHLWRSPLTTLEGLFPTLPSAGWSLSPAPFAASRTVYNLTVDVTVTSIPYALTASHPSATAVVVNNMAARASSPAPVTGSVAAVVPAASAVINVTVVDTLTSGSAAALAAGAVVAGPTTYLVNIIRDMTPALLTGVSYTASPSVHGGAAVNVTGAGFLVSAGGAAVTTVTIGTGTCGPVVIVSASLLTCTAPPGIGAGLPIGVVQGGIASAVSAGVTTAPVFSYAPMSVSSVQSNATSAASGGAVVVVLTITGVDFSHSAQTAPEITVGGRPCVNATYESLGNSTATRQVLLCSLGPGRVETGAPGADVVLRRPGSTVTFPAGITFVPSGFVGLSIADAHGDDGSPSSYVSNSVGPGPAAVPVCASVGGALEGAPADRECAVLVRLGVAPTADVRVPVAASNPAQIVPVPSEIVFPAGERGPIRVVLRAVDDRVVDPVRNETVGVTFGPTDSGDPNYAAAIGDALTASTFAIDNDAVAVLLSTVATATGSASRVLNEGSTLTLRVALATDVSMATTVAVSVSDTTEASISGADTVTFTPGGAAQGTLVLTGVADGVVDGLKTVDVVASVIGDAATAGPYAGARGSVSVVVVDRDRTGPPTIATLDPASTAFVVSENGTLSAELWVGMTDAPQLLGGEVGVRVDLSDPAEFAVAGRATASFNATTWAEGPVLFTLRGVDDLRDDANRAGTVTVTGTGLGPLGLDSVTFAFPIVNVDDDTAGIDATVAGWTDERGTGAATVHVRLESQPVQGSTVAVRARAVPVSQTDAGCTLRLGDHGSAGPETTVRFTAADWSAAQAVVVSGVRDAVVGTVQVEVALDASGSSDATYAALAVPARRMLVPRFDIHWPSIASVSPAVSPMLGRNGTLRLTRVTPARFTIAVGGVVAPIFRVRVAGTGEIVPTPWLNVSTGLPIVAGATAGRGAGMRQATLSSPSLPPAELPAADLVVEIAYPVHNVTGAASVSVVNADGGDGSLPAALYYTDDCPFEGQFGRGLDCVACPSNAVCPGGERMWPKDGFWTPGETTGEIYRCTPSDSCIGGQNYRCSFGYEGDLCAKCSDGFWARGEACAPCGGSTSSILLALMDAVFLVALMLGILFLREPVLNNLMSGIAVLQLLRAAGQLDTSGMPGWMQSIFAGFAIATGDIDFVRPECLSAHDELSSLYAAIGLDLGGRLVLLCAIGLHRFAPVYRRRAEEAGVDPRGWHPILIKVRLVRGNLLLCVFTFLNLSSKAFGVIACTRINGVYKMIAAPSVTCYAGAHAVGTAFACIVLVYALCFPVAIVRFLRANRERLFVEDLLLLRMGSLYEHYRFHMFGAFVVIMLLPIAAVISLLRREKVVQVALLLVIFALEFVTYAALRPFRRRYKNIIAVTVFFMLVCCSALLLASLLISRKAELEGRDISDTRDVMGALVVGVVVVAVLVIVAVIYTFTRRNVEAEARKAHLDEIMAKRERLGVPGNGSGSGGRSDEGYSDGSYDGSDAERTRRGYLDGDDDGGIVAAAAAAAAAVEGGASAPIRSFSVLSHWSEAVEPMHEPYSCAGRPPSASSADQPGRPQRAWRKNTSGGTVGAPVPASRRRTGAGVSSGGSGERPGSAGIVVIGGRAQRHHTYADDIHAGTVQTSMRLREDDARRRGERGGDASLPARQHSKASKLGAEHKATPVKPDQPSKPRKSPPPLPGASLHPTGHRRNSRRRSTVIPGGGTHPSISVLPPLVAPPPPRSGPPHLPPHLASHLHPSGTGGGVRRHLKKMEVVDVPGGPKHTVLVPANVPGNGSPTPARSGPSPRGASGRWQGRGVTGRGSHGGVSLPPVGPPKLPPHLQSQGPSAPTPGSITGTTHTPAATSRTHPPSPDIPRCASRMATDPNVERLSHSRSDVSLIALSSTGDHQQHYEYSRDARRQRKGLGPRSVSRGSSSSLGHAHGEIERESSGGVSAGGFEAPALPVSASRMVSGPTEARLVRLASVEDNDHGTVVFDSSSVREPQSRQESRESLAGRFAQPSRSPTSPPLRAVRRLGDE